jgi:hypothetical protein
VECWSCSARSTSGVRGSETSAAASAVMTACFRLGDQSRAREERDPIEFSFHNFGFLFFVLKSFC